MANQWFWLHDEDRQLVPLQNQTLYTEDWLGLRHLNEQGRLEFLVCPGQHVGENRGILY